MGKISALPQDSTPTGDDFLVSVNMTTNTTQKVLVSDLLKNHLFTNPYKFSARLSADQTVPASTDTKLLFATENFDTSGNFSTVDNRFTAPIDGFYFFIGHATNSGTGVFNLVMRKNGVAIRLGDDLAPASNVSSGSISELLQLAAGDYIEIWVNSAATTIYFGSAIYNYTYFSGFLVSAS